MSPPGLCRLCAESKETLIGIYDPEGEELSVSTKIAKCLQIQISAEDELPLSICSECSISLDRSFEFFETAKRAQASLRRTLNESTVVRPKQERPDDYCQSSDDSAIRHDEDLLDESEDRKTARKKPKVEKSDQNELKIPDNYMTGTDSDLELIDAKESGSQKINRKICKDLNRYPWLCTDCNDKSPSLETLEQHHKIVHNQQPKYMCVQCCKVYNKYYGFLMHVKRHKTKPKFKCEDCGKSFVHKKVLDSHKAIHSEERPHVCQTCGKSFRQQSALYIHSRCHLPETIKNRYPCDQCDKRFSTKPNLVTHKRIHSGVRNFTCDQCGKSFIQKGNLEAHFLTHSVDKPYNCSQCAKAFKTPLQLKKHETVHSGAKPHQCAVCGRTFRERGTLREHHRIHTGAMPFTCEFCGKSFRFKGILTTHRRQHTGERPYSCLECQHHFTNWPNYNKHMKRRHGINTSRTKHLKKSQDADPDNPTNVQVTEASALQNFAAEEMDFKEERAYFDASVQNLLPPSLSYNIYNVKDNDLIERG